MLRLALVLAVLATGCKSDTEDAPAAAPGSGSSGSAAKKGPGFAAELSADLAGSGSAAPSPAPAVDAASGSAASGSAASGSAAPVVDAASGSAAPVVDAASGSAMSGSAASGSASAPAVPLTPPPPSSSPRVPAKVPPELAAIKLSLQPNWDRDVGDAGTISLVVKRPVGDPAIFTFQYGYDDKAPSDRDAYLKYLGDTKQLAVTLNRQRGAAWYLEGTDATGAPAFRFLVNYGGKHLVCFGSLYKDAASSAMGDIRDEVINQAKKICETLAL